MIDPLAAAKAGDAQAFTELMALHRSELRAYCYRMLGSLDDAEDALQETMVAAWRGLHGFQGRSSLRAWLYRIATNCCLRLASRRPRRMVSWEYGPARSPRADLGEPVTEPIWLDPWPGDATEVDEDADPAALYGRKEGIHLAYVAALQRLPANQRAVLILREVLAFSAAEVAELLDTSAQAVNSTLQRARKTLAGHGGRLPVDPGRADEHAELVDAFVHAFERSDVAALVQLLAEDVRFTMPPLPAWFDGRDDVATFFAERVFEAPWRGVRIWCNRQPAVAGYQHVEGSYRLGAVMVLTCTHDQISWIASFLDPATLGKFGLPAVL